MHLDDRAKVFIQGLGIVDVRIADKAGKFGELGIGEITAGVLGDPLFLTGGIVGMTQIKTTINFEVDGDPASVLRAATEQAFAEVTGS